MTCTFPRCSCEPLSGEVECEAERAPVCKFPNCGCEPLNGEVDCQVETGRMVGKGPDLQQVPRSLKDLPPPWFWQLMTQVERNMWNDPRRSLVFRGNLSRRMERIHKDLPPMALAAPPQHTNHKCGEGYRFPGHRAAPVEMAVFDDSELHKQWVHKGDRTFTYMALLALVFGLGLMAKALWELSQ